MATLSTPVGAGAAGGSITITEMTSVGRCSYTVPTVAGDTATTIANNAAALFNSSTNDGKCRDLQKARDVVVRSPALRRFAGHTIERRMHDMTRSA